MNLNNEELNASPAVDVASKLGISYRYVLKLIKDGEIFAKKVGNTWLISVNEEKKICELSKKYERIAIPGLSEYLTYKDFYKLTGISKVKMIEFFKEGKIKIFKVGNEYLMKKEEVERFMKTLEGKGE